jgi:hypothetical protein
MTDDKPLEIIKGMRGVREAFYLDKEILEKVKAEELTVTSPGTGTAVNNIGVTEALKRDKVICIIKDPRFRPPPEPTVILKCSDGQILGVEVFPDTQDQYIGKEGCLMVSDGFVVFLNVIPTEGSNEAFVMPPVSFPELNESNGCKNVVSCSPAPTSDKMIREYKGLPDDAKLASILVAYDIA